jgi:excisionase family DNA binding protein
MTDSANLRSRLLELRAAVDRVLDEIPSEPAVRAPEPSSTWQTLTEFARAHRLHPDTVRRYVRQGMPALRAGRSYRIRVEAADAWLAAGGALASSARCGERQGVQ